MVIWPKEVPGEYVELLKREAQNAKERAARVAAARLLGPTEMRKDAKGIERTALRLLKQVQSFRDHYHPVLVNDRVKEMAQEHFVTHASPDDAELEAFRVGLGDYSIECAILGLVFKMQVLDVPKARGCSKVIEQQTVGIVAFHASKIPIPVGKNDVFIQIVQNVFDLAGFSSSDDAITHYIRKLKKQKSR